VKKAIIIIPWLLLLCIVLSAEACDTPQTSSESNQVNDQQTIYSNSQPLHKYDYSPERDELQQIYDARMKLTNTWTVIFSMGKPIFVCPSRGYPIPYTTQLTNPDRLAQYPGGSTATVTLPQAEPNGLYTGTSTATWVLCIRTLPGGGSEIDPVYSEPDALAFSYPVKIADDGTIQDAGGSSSVSINIKE
jgi:hypothetical protein